MINVIDIIKTISRSIYASIVFRESCLQKIDVCYTCHINNHEKIIRRFHLYININLAPVLLNSNTMKNVIR